MGTDALTLLCAPLILNHISAAVGIMRNIPLAAQQRQQQRTVLVVLIFMQAIVEQCNTAALSVHRNKLAVRLIRHTSLSMRLPSAARNHIKRVARKAGIASGSGRKPHTDAVILCIVFQCHRRGKIMAFLFQRQCQANRQLRHFAAAAPFALQIFFGDLNNITNFRALTPGFV